MKTAITVVATCVAVVLIVAQVSFATAADTDTSPGDAAATQKLNDTIANCNKSEDDRFQAQQAEFQHEREQNQRTLMEFEGQNDAMHRQYDDLRANYALLEAQNDMARKENADLQQKYQDMQQKLQEAQANYDAILKASRPKPK